MRRLSVVAAAAVLLVGCASADPEPLPDLVGMTLREAEDAGRDGGFDVDHETDDGSTVWSAENWQVKSQQPSAGVAAGEVSLLVGRPDDEPAEDVEAAPDPEPTDEPQREPDAEPEPEPEPDAEQPSGSDWLTILEEQGAAYLEYVDRIEQRSTAVTVHMNMGDYREDSTVIGLDGETDRGIATDLCSALQVAGHTGTIVVVDVQGGPLVDTNPLEDSLVVADAPRCRVR